MNHSVIMTSGGQYEDPLEWGDEVSELTSPTISTVSGGMDLPVAEASAGETAKNARDLDPGTNQHSTPTEEITEETVQIEESQEEEEGPILEETTEMIPAETITQYNPCTTSEIADVDYNVQRRESNRLKEKRLKIQQEADAMMTLLAMLEPPEKFTDAMNSADVDNWKEAMAEEFQNLVRSHCFSLEEPPIEKRVIPSRWVYTLKKNELGEVIKFKARIVVQGFHQHPGVDFTDVYAPTTMAPSVRFVLSLAATYDLEIEQLDVTAAFLHADIDNVTYVKPPPGLYDNDQKVWKLHKALYGLRQSPKLWSDLLVKTLQKWSFKQTASDSCVFVSTNSRDTLWIVVFVDDLLVIGRNTDEVENVKKSLKSSFTIKDLGPVKHFLALTVTRDRPNRLLYLSQNPYITNILEETNMDQARPISLPSNDDSFPPFDQSEGQFICPYANVVGQISYLANWTRPDLAYSVNVAASFNQHHNEKHWQSLRNILRYLKSTKNMRLALGGIMSQESLQNGPLCCYSDASFACDASGASRSGMALMWNQAVFHWRSKRQTTIARSTAAAEITAAAPASEELIWARHFLHELGINHGPTPILYLDNQASIAIARGQDNGKMKHMKTALMSLVDFTRRNLIHILYCPTTLMIADALTKPLGTNKLRDFRTAMKVVDTA